MINKADNEIWLNTELRWCDSTAKKEITRQLGWRRTPNSRSAESLILSLFLLCEANLAGTAPGYSLRISRDKNWRHLSEPKINGEAIARSTDILVGAGMVVVERDGIQNIRSTTIRPTEKLMEIYMEIKRQKYDKEIARYVKEGKPYLSSDCRLARGERIYLNVWTNSGPGRTKSFQVMRSHKAALDVADIYVPSPPQGSPAEEVVRWMLTQRESPIPLVQYSGPVQNYTFALGRRYRSSSKDGSVKGVDYLAGGGRFVHSGLSFSSGTRQAMRINGEPVVELDVATCQPRIIMALAGVDLARRDVYVELSPSDRSLGKVAVMWLVGTTQPHSRKSLRWNLNNHLAWRGLSKIGDGHFDKMWDNIQEIFGPALERGLFGPRPCGLAEGAWFLTQKQESDWLCDTLCEFYDQAPDSLAIPWHDSIVVPTSQAQRLHDNMMDSWEARFGFAPIITAEAKDGVEFDITPRIPEVSPDIPQAQVGSSSIPGQESKPPSGWQSQIDAAWNGIDDKYIQE